MITQRIVCLLCEQSVKFETEFAMSARHAFDILKTKAEEAGWVFTTTGGICPKHKIKEDHDE